MSEQTLETPFNMEGRNDRMWKNALSSKHVGRGVFWSFRVYFSHLSHVQLEQDLSRVGTQRLRAFLSRTERSELGG